MRSRCIIRQTLSMWLSSGKEALNKQDIWIVFHQVPFSPHQHRLIGCSERMLSKLMTGQWYTRIPMLVDSFVLVQAAAVGHRFLIFVSDISVQFWWPRLIESLDLKYIKTGDIYSIHAYQLHAKTTEWRAIDFRFVCTAGSTNWRKRRSRFTMSATLQRNGISAAAQGFIAVCALALVEFNRTTGVRHRQI